ncbi:MAG: uroporphyrinogen-III decarboxylase-like protein [Candidatus Omnitrophica bacterium]|nr:uroporphyrinogen-III decarboxylase-like protein [Candidatus Omnitrophota bacterium]
MTSKERILGILNREKVDRIPVDLWHTDEVLQSLKDHTGLKDKLAIYRKLGVDRILWAETSYLGETRPPEGADEVTDHWGCRRRTVQAGAAEYDEFVDYPLAGYDSPDSLDDYPWWPDVDQYDYQKMAAHVVDNGDEFATFGPWISFFEVYCWMRGLENAMMDLALTPDLVQAALDRIEDHQTQMVRRFLKACPEKVDMALVSDDMGGQKSLLMSIRHWKEFIGPRLKRWCDLFHDHGIKVFYHSDGSIDALIPHLIEAGIDILNPIQHVCPGMDRGHLKGTSGDRLIFHGGVDNQSALPFGSPEDVRVETRECLRTLGDRGGYICCSCHNVQAGTPVENILAMIETVHREGNRWL